MYDPKELTMQEEELKNIWNKSGDKAMINIRLDELTKELQNNMQKFENKIRKRDTLEIIGAIASMLIFGFIGYEFPFPSSKVAAVIGVIWSAYVIYRLKRTQKRKSSDDFTRSVENQLIEHKQHLQRQGKLLSTVWYWYVLPPFLANAVLFLGMGNPADYNWTPVFLSPPYSIGEKLFVLGFLALFYGFIIIINLKAVRVNIKPAIREVEQMQRQFTQANE